MPANQESSGQRRFILEVVLAAARDLCVILLCALLILGVVAEVVKESRTREAVPRPAVLEQT